MWSRFRIDEHIAWLQVAMDHQSSVRVADRIAQRQKHVQSRLQRRRLLCAPLRQRLAFDVCHGHEWPPILAHPAIDQTCDAGMIQRRQEASFGLQPSLATHTVRAQQLQGGRLLELTVHAVGQINLAHAAATEQTFDPPIGDHAA